MLTMIIFEKGGDCEIPRGWFVILCRVSQNIICIPNKAGIMPYLLLFFVEIQNNFSVKSIVNKKRINANVML